MAKQYQYKAIMEILQGGYEGEAKGVSPADDNWHTTSDLHGSATYSYFYTDSDRSSNDHSSRVTLNVTDTWNVDILDDNTLSVSIHTVLNSIYRGDIRGNISGKYPFDIVVKRSKNSTQEFVNVSRDAPNIAHSIISQPVDMGTETYTLAPGENLYRSSIYILNHTSGFPWEERYTDEMEAGIAIRNILPKDYRPGMSWNGSAWMSHNRNSGVCNVYQNGAWTECRTESYPSGKGNAPLMYRDGDYWNQAQIGQE